MTLALRVVMPHACEVCTCINSKVNTNMCHHDLHASLLLHAPAAYQAIIANDPGAEGGDDEKAPRPNKPADRGPGSALRARMDTRRVMHARYEQQSRLIRYGCWAFHGAHDIRSRTRMLGG
jgi:hypothetical protein